MFEIIKNLLNIGKKRTVGYCEIQKQAVKAAGYFVGYIGVAVLSHIYT